MEIPLSDSTQPNTWGPLCASCGPLRTPPCSLSVPLGMLLCLSPTLPCEDPPPTLHLAFWGPLHAPSPCCSLRTPSVPYPSLWGHPCAPASCCPLGTTHCPISMLRFEDTPLCAPFGLLGNPQNLISMLPFGDPPCALSIPLGTPLHPILTLPLGTPPGPPLGARCQAAKGYVRRCRSAPGTWKGGRGGRHGAEFAAVPEKAASGRQR